MLMSIVILFLICNSIKALSIWLSSSPKLSNIEILLDPAPLTLISELALLINSSANFILYCVMGTKFRTECIMLVCRNFARIRSLLRFQIFSGSPGVPDIHNSSHVQAVVVHRMAPIFPEPEPEPAPEPQLRFRKFRNRNRSHLLRLRKKWNRNRNRLLVPAPTLESEPEPEPRLRNRLRSRII